ncbi:MAG: DNA repair protein RadA, partial [Candidatus Methylomirabilales bacterium]
MAKIRTHFECQQCGYQTPRWMGRCPECGGWGTLVEEHPATEAERAAGMRSPSAPPVPITEVQRPTLTRLPTGFPEVDRTLGGGVVPGSVVLIGGDPGIGKSTPCFRWQRASPVRVAQPSTSRERSR